VCAVCVCRLSAHGYAWVACSGRSSSVCDGGHLKSGGETLAWIDTTLSDGLQVVVATGSLLKQLQCDVCARCVCSVLMFVSSALLHAEVWVDISILEGAISSRCIRMNTADQYSDSICAVLIAPAVFDHISTSTAMLNVRMGTCLWSSPRSLPTMLSISCRAKCF
jgi:hypothetical protein